MTTANTTNNFWRLKQGFILASGSPQRRALLAQVRLEPESIVSPDVCEDEQPGELPAQYVKRIALAKARAVAQLHPNKIIVAADTILAVGRRFIRKALTEEEARKHLALLSGRRHRVITGLCVITAQGKEIVLARSTSVSVKKLSHDDMRFILASHEWQNVAGYRIEGIIAAFVKHMNGSFDNVVGLPLYDVVRILRGVSNQ